MNRTIEKRRAIANLSAIAFLAFSAGCLQLTGVADYKVEEAPVCTPPAGSECRVAPQCGCAEGNTCELQSVEGAGACKPAGPVARHGACSVPGECAQGMLCIDRTCEPYCATDDDCDTRQCMGFTVDGTPVPNIGYCATPCDPSAVTCPDGRACKFASRDETICVPAGPRADGESCKNDGECGAGLVCGDGSLCTPLCTVGTTCPDGAACKDAGLVYGGTTYGYCPRG
ncbi:MAG: hypothetical protein HYV09_33660 [Deltaproteobacteria bacterium]|nr:hypothetical protein [Deltaproteobacteria bacterium]